jgi:hypothetical protein
LRKQALAAIEALAATEDDVARIYEELAAERPERRDEHWRTAEQARTSGRRAREVLRRLTS